MRRDLFPVNGQNPQVLWRIPGRAVKHHVLLGVPWKRQSRHRSEPEPLKHTHKEQEVLLLSQALAQTVTLANAKWTDVLVFDEFPFFADETIRFECVRIRKVLWVTHDFKQGGVDDASLQKKN